MPLRVKQSCMSHRAHVLLHPCVPFRLLFPNESVNLMQSWETSPPGPVEFQCPVQGIVLSAPPGNAADYCRIQPARTKLKLQCHHQGIASATRRDGPPVILFSHSLFELPPDQRTLASFTRFTFQHYFAYEKMQIKRKATFDDPAISSYDLYVDRDGTWWHVNFFVAEEMTVLPTAIRQYINTVSFP